jgi:hypothetical protein
MKYDLEIKAGSTWPPLSIALKNEFNSAVNISGQKGASMYMRIRSTDSVTVINGRSVSVTDSSNGYLNYGWTVADTSGYDGKQAQAHFNITMSDNSLMRAPTDGYFDVYIGSVIG